MKIAFDIDGVLTDLEKFQIEYGSRFFKKKYNKEIKNPEGESIREIFKCTKEQEYDFWKNYLLFYSSKIPIRDGCVENIKKIYDEGNEIYIISSRIKSTSNDIIGMFIRLLVKRFLKDIPYNDITFCSIENSAKEKAEACKKYNIDVIVEDTPKNIEELKKVTKVMCFNTVYNKNVPDDIIKVNSFNDIYNIINKMNKNFEFKYLSKTERDNLSLDELRDYYKNLKEYYIRTIDKSNISKCEKNYYNIYNVAKKIFDNKYPYEVINGNNIPDETGVIYVANHRDMIDPTLVMSVVGKKPIHLLLKAEFKDGPFGNFLSSIGCVFVRRDNKDSQIISKEELIKLVLSGSDIIIFPEGTRNKTNEELLDFQLGAVSIARVTGAPIVPISISKKFDDFNEKIVLNVGEKFYINYTDDLVVKNGELKSIILEMLNESKEFQIQKRQKKLCN